MKKLLSVLIVIIFIALAVGAYYYIKQPVVKVAVLCKSIDSNGKPVDEFKGKVSSQKTEGKFGKSIRAKTITYVVLSKDTTIYTSVKVLARYTKNMKIIWYKGDPSSSGRIKVDNNVPVKSSYASSKLTIPQGLKEGKYSVNIYQQDSDISEKTLNFEVKK